MDPEVLLQTVSLIREEAKSDEEAESAVAALGKDDEESASRRKAFARKRYRGVYKSASGWTAETGPRGGHRWRRGGQVTYTDPAAGDGAASSQDGNAKTDVTEDVKKGRIEKFKDYGKELAVKLGKPIWDKLSPKWQDRLATAYGVALKIEHKLESNYQTGQELAKAVAEQKGYAPEHVERVGRILGVADAVQRWTTNIPIVHHVLDLTGVGGLVSFLGAKAGWYIPVASLAYVGYHVGTSTATGKNPFKLIQDARAKVREKMKAKAEAGKNHE